MKHKVLIEKISEFSSMGAVKDILLQEGIVLAAVGSSACIASLKYIAALMGRSHKLYTRDLSAREYSLGKNGSIAAALVQEAFSFPGLKGVIVYCSCLDILTHWDEEAILDSLQNTKNIPVAFLYRGPLVKRKMLPKEALNRIWKQWGVTPVMESIDLHPAECEVEVDFKRVILEHDGDEAIILVTPGGCASCLMDVPMEKMNRLYNTRFDDLFLCSCTAADFAEGIKAYFSPDVKLLLLGTAVTKAAGISLEKICALLKQEGYMARFIATDGFKK